MISPGQAAFQLAFQLSPIFLTDGLASALGGVMPITALTEGLSFGIGALIGGGSNVDLNRFFANYAPLPGTTIFHQEVGHYPFANQAIAANATITMPLRISFLMDVSIRNRGGYVTKLATMMALKATLENHTGQGGTFALLTPSNLYSNCLLLKVEDTSDPRSKQPQNKWRWDFEAPLISLDQAQQAQNSLMSKITQGTPFSVPPSSFGLTQASPPSPSVIPEPAPSVGEFS